MTLPIPTAAAPFVVDDDVERDFEPAPLEAGWNIEGNADPQMRFSAMSADGDLSSGIWTCGPGTFRFSYDFDEFVHFISGGASIRSSDGCSRVLASGDTAFFPRGLETVWTVEDHVRKFFVLRNPPRSVRIARRVGGQLNALFSFL